MSTASVDDDDDVPSADVCDQLCKNFAEVTNSDTAMGHFFLQQNQWNLERALHMYFQANGDTNDSAVQSPKRVDDVPGASLQMESAAALLRSSLSSASGATATGTQQDDDQPKNFRLLSWNIDGLDQQGIGIRTRAACTIILRDKPTVVFLQEVVNESVTILADYLSDDYWVLRGRQHSSVPHTYMTAMLLDRKAVELDREPQVISFSGSSMGRELLKIEVEIFGTPCVLMTSHLESGRDYARERVQQLRLCFDALTKQVPDNITAFFGGDMNLRDTELMEVGGIPTGVEDLWISCGSPKECQYTWNCMKNDNIGGFQGAEFKPRCRFDRIYVKHCSTDKGPIWKPVKFSLVGTERIHRYGRFPSDHWGVMIDFEKI